MQEDLDGWMQRHRGSSFLEEGKPRRQSFDKDIASFGQDVDRLDKERFKVPGGHVHSLVSLMKWTCIADPFSHSCPETAPCGRVTQRPLSHSASPLRRWRTRRRPTKLGWPRNTS